MENLCSIVELHCECQKGDKTFKWNSLSMANLSTNKINYNIEGPVDFDNKQAYILGITGLDKDRLEFTLLTDDNKIIDFKLEHDMQDNNYYGNWYYVNNNEPIFGGYTKICMNEVKDDDISIYSINKEIEILGHNYFYPKYASVISHLLLTKSSNVSIIEKQNNYSRYSKNYFKTVIHFVNQKNLKKKI